jgi:hypothetical protein
MGMGRYCARKVRLAEVECGPQLADTIRRLNKSRWHAITLVMFKEVNCGRLETPFHDGRVQAFPLPTLY